MYYNQGMSKSKIAIITIVIDVHFLSAIESKFILLEENGVDDIMNGHVEYLINRCSTSRFLNKYLL